MGERLEQVVRPFIYTYKYAQMVSSNRSMRYLSGAILVMAFLFALLPCEAKAIEATHLIDDRVYQDADNEIVTIDGVNLEGLSGAVVLRLRRVSLTDDNTNIHVFDGSSESEVIHDKLLAYVGEIVNHPSSKAVITIIGRNEIDGYVEDGSIKWRLSGRYGSRIRQTDVLLNSKAQQDNLSMGLDSDIEYPVEDDRVRLFNTTKESSGEQLPSGRLYQAKIAIDVDGELFNMLGGMEKTVSYVTTLLGYVSSIYSKEVGMRFVVSDLYIWKDPALDPWTYDNTKDALVEYKNYWEQNRVSVIRSLSHLLSGRRIGGGRTYYNGLCSTRNGYGVSGG